MSCILALCLLLLPSINEAALPLCKPGEHRKGRWVVDTPQPKKSWWHCCGNDGQAWRSNPICENHTQREEYSHGQRNLYHLIGGNACVRDCADGPGLLSATWRPKHCTMLPWDPEKFCQALGNRTLAIIGDSTAQQTGTTLMAALHNHCVEQIHFYLADTVVLGPYGKNNRGFHWLDAYFSRHHDVILLAIGAHFINSRDYGIMLHTVIAEYRSLPKKPLLIWRTVSGAGCHRTILPRLPSVLNTNGTFWHQTAIGWQPFYGWDLFEGYDVVARQLLNNTEIPILDVEPLYMRMDAHPGSPRIQGHNNGGDCMHYCAGSHGPFRFVFTALHHILLHYPA